MTNWLNHEYRVWILQTGYQITVSETTVLEIIFDQYETTWLSYQISRAIHRTSSVSRDLLCTSYHDHADHRGLWCRPKGLFRISCKRGWYFCWGGGVPVSSKVSEGGYEYFAKMPGRGIHFLRTQKKTERGKMPLSRDSPADIVRFAPPALKSIRHSTYFWRRLRGGGGTKILRKLRKIFYKWVIGCSQIPPPLWMPLLPIRPIA